MSTTISMNRTELTERRQELLRSTGMTYEQLRSRANSYTLRPEERDAYEMIRSIDFLLGE